MDKKELLELLRKAAQATREYANAIDTQLYQLSCTYYSKEKEDATYKLADDLDKAVAILEDE